VKQLHQGAILPKGKNTGTECAWPHSYRTRAPRQSKKWGKREAAIKVKGKSTSPSLFRARARVPESKTVQKRIQKTTKETTSTGGRRLLKTTARTVLRVLTEIQATDADRRTRKGIGGPFWGERHLGSQQVLAQARSRQLPEKTIASVKRDGIGGCDYWERKRGMIEKKERRTTFVAKKGVSVTRKRGRGTPRANQKTKRNQ